MYELKKNNKVNRSNFVWKLSTQSYRFEHRKNSKLLPRLQRVELSAIAGSFDLAVEGTPRPPPGFSETGLFQCVIQGMQQVQPQPRLTCDRHIRVRPRVTLLPPELNCNLVPSNIRTSFPVILILSPCDRTTFDGKCYTLTCFGINLFIGWNSTRSTRTPCTRTDETKTKLTNYWHAWKRVKDVIEQFYRFLSRRVKK